MTLLFYQTGFIKTLMVLNPNKCSVMVFDVKDEFQIDL